MKKVLLVNGSPHAEGCVYTDLMEVAGALEKHGVSWELFQLGTAPIRGCISCRRCRESHVCVFEDDIANALLQKFRECDGVIVGSPTYYAGPNGALCAVLDRVFQCDQRCGSFAGKSAAVVINCRRGGASAAFDRLNKYFTMNRMPLVSSQYWNAVHGTTPEECRQDLEGMQTMRTLGDQMAWMLAGLQSEPQPAKEPWIMTNFIR